MPVTVTTRVDDRLLKLIDRIAEKEGMDRTTIIRRFLMGSTAEWIIEKSLEEYEEKMISFFDDALLMK